VLYLFQFQIMVVNVGQISGEANVVHSTQETTNSCSNNLFGPIGFGE